MTDNLMTVLGALADVLRAQDPDLVARMLAPDVVWEGLEPDQRCDGREQAMRLIGRRFVVAAVTVDRVEVIGAGDRVVVALRGPGFNPTPGDVTTYGEYHGVFTLHEGKVVHWKAYPDRARALAAAGVGGAGEP